MASAAANSESSANSSVHIGSSLTHPAKTVCLHSRSFKSIDKQAIKTKNKQIINANKQQLSSWLFIQVFFVYWQDSGGERDAAHELFIRCFFRFE